MAITEFRKSAAELAEPASKLLTGVLEKYTASILEEMHDQLASRDAEIENLRAVLGTAIAWLQQHYGDAATKQLLEMLDKAESHMLDKAESHKGG